MSPVLSNLATLKNKIIFTLLLLAVFRVGSYVPIAGVNSAALSEITAQNSSGILGLFNMLSGGSLGRMSIFALAIMPYITASIIIQLMSIAYKPLDDLKKEGTAGRRKINQLSRYLTILLASVQAYGIAVSLQHMQTSHGSVIVIPILFFKVSAVITLVVGTIFLMWLGEQISSKGIGNGSSLIIFTGIVSGLPNSVISLFELCRKGVISYYMVLFFIIIVLSLVLIIVFCEKCYRKVVISYPKRALNSNDVSSNYIPIKLNTCGVIPPMFASSVLLFPLTVANFYEFSSPAIQWLLFNFGRGKPLFLLTYIFLIVFFSFFYTAVVFNSEETANNLKKNSAFIPGKRPGSSTAQYFDYILTRITILGAFYLCFICVIPEVIMSKIPSFALGGTSLLITVNVIIETFSQIQSHLLSNRYGKIVKKIKFR